MNTVMLFGTVWLVRGHFVLVGNNSFCVHKVSMYSLVTAKSLPMQPIEPMQRNAANLGTWWWSPMQPIELMQ